ncbi:MAG: hypothetical protein FWF81_00800 [Defluviitaleaceae bacterium]|nr:hypothetical protein [Defluviitaleaceae bacterium]
MDYEIRGATLKSQAFEITFEHDILKVLFHNNIFIVCINPNNVNGEVIRGIENNIYGLSLDGEIIWQIQDPREVYAKTYPNLHWSTYGAFFGVEQIPNGSFTAFAWDARYNLDYLTGKVSGMSRTW